MADYPGWYQDPTGRHSERHFDSNGIPTQLVRRNGLEFMDADPPSHVDATSLSAPPSVPVASYRAPAGTDYHWPTQQVSVAPPASPPPVIMRRKRNWWLIGASCIVGVLLVAAITAAYQQHKDSDQ